MNHFRLAIAPSHAERDRIAIEEILNRKELYFRAAYGKDGQETAFLAEGWMDAGMFQNEVMQPLVPYIKDGFVRMLPCGDRHMSSGMEEPAAEFLFDQAAGRWVRHGLPLICRLQKAARRWHTVLTGRKKRKK